MVPEPEGKVADLLAFVASLKIFFLFPFQPHKRRFLPHCPSFPDSSQFFLLFSQARLIVKHKGDFANCHDFYVM